MKYRLRTLLKHKLQWLVLLTALLCMSQGVWGDEAVPVYCAVSDTELSTASANTVKVNANIGDNNTWRQYTMTSTGDSYSGATVYEATIYEKYGGVNVLQFQLYNGSTWKAQKQPYSSWTTSSTFSGKLYVYSTGTWTTYTPCTPPSAQITTDTQTKCVGGSFTSITVSTEGTVSSYQWKVSTDGSSYTNVSDGTGGATDTFTPSSATPGTRYYKCTVSGCNTSVTTTNLVTCTTNGVSVSVSPAVGSIHEYEPVTFTASGSATWSINTVPTGITNGTDAYLSTTSGASTIFKGAKGTSGSYKVRATANGCDTDTTFSVAEWDDDCN